jgi:hypothetical protein
VARVLSHLSSDGVAERKSKTLYVRQVERLKQLCEKASAHTAKIEEV